MVMLISTLPAKPREFRESQRRAVRKQEKKEFSAGGGGALFVRVLGVSVGSLMQAPSKRPKPLFLSLKNRRPRTRKATFYSTTS